MSVPPPDFAMERCCHPEGGLFDLLLSALHRRAFAEAEERRATEAEDSFWGPHIVDMLDRIGPMIAAHDAPSALAEIECAIYFRHPAHVRRVYAATPKAGAL